MTAIRVLSLLGFLMLTFGALMAQSTYVPLQPSVTDALQDQKISTLELASARHSDDIRQLTLELSALRSSMDRFTGIGIGIGAILTVLQAMQMIMQAKRKT